MGRTCLKRSISQNATSHVAAALVLLLAAHLSPRLLAAEQLIDRLLAEVNGDAILLSEVQAKVEKGPLVAVSAFPAVEGASEFEVALQDAINFELIKQRAEELEIEVSEDRLEEEINRFMTRRKLTRAQLLEALGQQGMTYEQYREDFRNQILLNQFQGREILPSVKITDKDVELLYLNQQGGKTENVKLTLRQLYIALPDGASESIVAGKTALISRIEKELKAGMDFEKAVRLYSDQSSGRETGGLMPPLALSDINADFREAVAGLKEGEFSEAIETSAGYFFLYVEKREFAGSAEYESMKPQLESQLQQQEVLRQTVQWIENQRRRSEIRVIEDDE